MQQIGALALVGRDWVDYANFGVLTATLITVGIYSWLTHRLRAEAEKQNESSVLPILILDWPNSEFDNADTPSVENIGRGPAFNVQIEPIVHDGIKVAFPEFGLLQVKDRNAPLMQITQAVQAPPGHLIQQGFMPSTQTLAGMIQRHGFPDCFTITIRYEDLTRKRYSTAFTVRFDPLRELFNVAFGGMKRL